MNLSTAPRYNKFPDFPTSHFRHTQSRDHAKRQLSTHHRQPQATRNKTFYGVDGAGAIIGAGVGLRGAGEGEKGIGEGNLALVEMLLRVGKKFTAASTVFMPGLAT
jgi:hypothetical protein